MMMRVVIGGLATSWGTEALTMPASLTCWHYQPAPWGAGVIVRGWKLLLKFIYLYLFIYIYCLIDLLISIACYLHTVFTDIILYL